MSKSHCDSRDALSEGQSVVLSPKVLRGHPMTRRTLDAAETIVSRMIVSRMEVGSTPRHSLR